MSERRDSLEATGAERPPGGAFTVLTGHESPDTALESGGRRYWVEEGNEGRETEVRLVTQEAAPGGGWGRRTVTPYADWGWMYRDHRDGAVKFWRLPSFDIVKGVAKTKAAGLWPQIDREVRYDLIDAEILTRRLAPEYHAGWDADVARVRAAVKAHGCPPVVAEGDLYRLGGLCGPPPVWKADFKLALALVRAEEFAEFTYPALKPPKPPKPPKPAA